jgi:2-dehydropantoate 2-reductase
MNPRPVIAVIGAGALGGYYGARLAQSGHDVHLHMRSDCQAVRKNGMRIQSVDGDFALAPAQVHVYDDPARMPAADLVLVTLKTTANDRLGELVAPVLKADSAILTLQNGLGNEERLAELFGSERVMGGIAFACINRTGPGQIAHLDHGLIRLGEYQRPPSERAQWVAELFNRSNVPCGVLDNLAAGRWEKLVWNVPFNGLGALLDYSTDLLLQRASELVRQLMREVIDAAAALEIDFDPALIEEKMRQTLSMGAYKSSMQIDRQMHRPMEIEAIIGKPLAEAARRGVATPALEMLYHLLRAINSP